MGSRKVLRVTSDGVYLQAAAGKKGFNNGAGFMRFTSAATYEVDGNTFVITTQNGDKFRYLVSA
jgi:hypothetical protein